MQFILPTQEPASRHDEFVTLLTSSHLKLLGYLRALLGRWHDAQDVLQRASLVMWKKFDTFQSGTDFMAWATTICFYEAKLFQRTSARSPLYFDDDLLSLLAEERLTDLSQHEQRLTALEGCLTKLREEDRRLVLAACQDHGGITALAAQLNRAPATLYNKLTQLRRLLADCVITSIQKNYA
jgi:RNA polymerase sigma-70 factor, ECF subfamily